MNNAWDPNEKIIYVLLLYSVPKKKLGVFTLYFIMFMNEKY